MTPAGAPKRPRAEPEMLLGLLWLPLWVWLLPLYLRLDPLSESAIRPVTAWTAFGAIVAAPLLRPLRAHFARTDGTWTTLERPSRWALDLGYAATIAALVGFVAVSRSPSVPYMDALSLVSLQVASGAVVGLLAFFLAARRRRADERIDAGRPSSSPWDRPGLPGLLFATTATLSLVAVTALGVGAVHRAEGTRRFALEQQVIALADLAADTLDVLPVDAQDRRDAVLQTLTTHGEVEAWLTSAEDLPAPLSSLARTHAHVGDQIYAATDEARYFGVVRPLRSERLWLVAPLSRPPAVRAPDDAPTLILLGLLALGVPLGAWLVGAELRAHVRLLERALTRLATQASTRIATPVWSDDEVGDVALELQRAVTLRDTENRALASALTGAAEADRARARFLAAASHELRTPLNTIAGYCHLVGRSSLTDAQREDVALIDAASAQLARHVDEILDVAAVESGDAQPLELQRIDLGDLVRQTLASLVPVHGESVTLSVIIDAPAPVVDADPRRLRQVVENIVGNAFKFTHAGSVRVHVGRHGAYACIEVTDSGPGIPAGELTQIFDEFHRVEAQRHVAGTGLGLTIAHRIVSQHDGHIEVESPPGRGATFRVCLPSRPSTGEVS